MFIRDLCHIFCIQITISENAGLMEGMRECVLGGGSVSVVCSINETLINFSSTLRHHSGRLSTTVLEIGGSGVYNLC